MYVSHLYIKNFRNFNTFNIDLKPFTLIIGANNAGKSNMLEAICLILSQEITAFKKRMLEVEDVNFEAIKAFKAQVFNPVIPIEIGRAHV